MSTRHVGHVSLAPDPLCIASPAPGELEDSDGGQSSLARGVVMGAPVSLLLWWLLLQLVVRVAS
ncbi:hypothetical protein M2338_002504 [Sphingobium sp. B2D3B]|nr:hypothetical protein [Sphingobium sp. B2D3B]MCW2400085.1 hypothetical protein [Sphingobium sp. B2D3C]